MVVIPINNSYNNVAVICKKLKFQKTILEGSTKPISKVVSKLFRKIFNQISSHHQKSTFYKNFNRIWIVQIFKPLIKKLNTFNSMNVAWKIQHLTLLLCTQTCPIKISFRFHINLLNFLFNGECNDQNGCRKYLTVMGRDCEWTKKKRGSNSIPCIK